MNSVIRRRQLLLKSLPTDSPSCSGMRPGHEESTSIFCSRRLYRPLSLCKGGQGGSQAIWLLLQILKSHSKAIINPIEVARGLTHRIGGRVTQWHDRDISIHSKLLG